MVKMYRIMRKEEKLYPSAAIKYAKGDGISIGIRVWRKMILRFEDVGRNLTKQEQHERNDSAQKTHPQSAEPSTDS